MAEVLKDETIRRRDVRLKMNWQDLDGLISFAVMEQIGAPDGSTVKVKLSQSEAGSPSYRIDEWTAVIEVTFPID